MLQVELSKHPHLLLLQVRNSMLKLPGGRVRPGESGMMILIFFLFCQIFYLEVRSLSTEGLFSLTYTEIECLRRKLSSNLSAREDDSWEVCQQLR